MCQLLWDTRYIKYVPFFTPRAESPEGYYYHGCGRPGGRAAGRPGGRAAVRESVVTRFFIQFFSYDPEISHACSLP